MLQKFSSYTPEILQTKKVFETMNTIPHQMQLSVLSFTVIGEAIVQLANFIFVKWILFNYDSYKWTDKILFI